MCVDIHHHCAHNYSVTVTVTWTWICLCKLDSGVNHDALCEQEVEAVMDLLSHFRSAQCLNRHLGAWDAEVDIGTVLNQRVIVLYILFATPSVRGGTL
jgi:hypothetical protein